MTLLNLLCTVSIAWGTPTLQDKLARQWQAYGQARQMLLAQVARTDLPLPQRMISRADWEKALMLTGKYALTSQDLAELRQSQETRIAMARARARQNSIVDFNQIRQLAQVKAFCENVPKGGMLHVHPTGTLNRGTVDKLIRRENPLLDMPGLLNDVASSGGFLALAPQEVQYLQTLSGNFLALPSIDQNRLETFLFLPPGKQPFPRFSTVFDFLGLAVVTLKDYDQALLDFAERAKREHVIYVEFTGGAPYLADVQATERATGVALRVNASFHRTQSPDSLDQSLTTLLARPSNSSLVGIDLLDNEDGYPALERAQLLYGRALNESQAGHTTLHRTMHAGEIGDVRDPRDAMILGAERLGHGVNLAKDPVALEYAARIAEPVEVNISSNLRLTDIPDASHHPYLNFLRLGLPISLSTDDEGIFDTDIQHECEVAVGETDLTYFEFKQMAFNSIATSFASGADKATLGAELGREFADFEKSPAMVAWTATKVLFHPPPVAGP